MTPTSNTVKLPRIATISKAGGKPTKVLIPPARKDSSGRYITNKSYIDAPLSKRDKLGAEKMTKLLIKENNEVKKALAQDRVIESNTDKPDILKRKFSVPQKRVVAKVLYQLGWGAKRVADWMKVSTPMVVTSTQLPTPVDLKGFEEAFRMAMQDMNMQLEFTIKNRLMELIPESTKITDIVKAGEYIGGGKRVSLTQNNFYSDMLSKYKQT